MTQGRFEFRVRTQVETREHRGRTEHRSASRVTIRDTHTGELTKDTNMVGRWRATLDEANEDARGASMIARGVLAAKGVDS